MDLSDSVILATPAPVSGSLLASFDSGLAAVLATIFVVMLVASTLLLMASVQGR